MPKLSAAKLESAASKCGVFDRETWQSCVAYLFELRSTDDPLEVAGWTQVMQLVKSFLEWALQQALETYGALGHECLYLAATCAMEKELQHEESDVPCVFSGRCAPRLYTTPTQAAPIAGYTRMQCRFNWWAHHETTGLESPHRSDLYVYESKYRYLVIGIYALGHLGGLLKHKAQICEAGASLLEFQTAPVWDETYNKINMILAVVCAQVTTK